MNPKIYAVLTGDLIGSRKLKDQGISYLEHLNESLEYVGHNYQIPFYIYRGDSFQGVTYDITSALKDAIILRLMLISSFEADVKCPRIDARISIGVGKIDLPINIERKIGEMDGEAFRNSGLKLEDIKKEKQNLAIITPWTEVNEELDIYCIMIDRLIARWSKKKCEAVRYRLEGHILEEIGNKLNIDPSSVFRRLKGTDYDLVEMITQRYSKIVNKKLDELSEDE